jgi:Tfp pilus assembly protein FimV
VAERTLAGQGIGAWPVCGKNAGSTKHYAAPRSSAPRSSAPRHAAPQGSHQAAPHQQYVPKHAAPSGHTYVVKSGDTLAKIATAKHVKGGWQALYQNNIRAIGGNPNLIFPGERLAL